MSLVIDKLTGQIYLFDISGGGGSGSTATYPEVNLFSQLPSAAANNGKIYVVRQPSGTFMINRKEAGLYYSNGVVWTRLGDIPSFFNDDNFQIYDGTDNTKQVRFQLSGVTSGQQRVVTVRDSNGTMAYLTDLNAKVDTSVFALYTGTTAPGQFLGISNFNVYSAATNTRITNLEHAITGVTGSDIHFENVVYVMNSGNDTTGNGTINKPYATVTKAMTSITGASNTNRYVIQLPAGNHTEASIALKPWVFIRGLGNQQTRLAVSTNKIVPDASFGTMNGRSGLIDLSLNGSTGINFDLRTLGNFSCVLDVNRCWVNGEFNFLGRISGADFLQVFNTFMFSNLNNINTKVAVGNSYVAGDFNVNLSGSTSNVDVDVNATELYSNVNIKSDGSNTTTVKWSACYIGGNHVYSGNNMTITSDAVSLSQTDSNITIAGGAVLSRITGAHAVSAGYTPSNYTAAIDTVKSHLTGIDAKLGSISVSGGTTYHAIQVVDLVGGIDVNTIAPTSVQWTNVEFTGSSLNYTGASRIYIQATGNYEITYNLVLKNGNNTSKTIGSVIKMNGTTNVTPLSVATYIDSGTSITGSNNIANYKKTFNAGDYIELQAFRIGGTGSAETIPEASFIRVVRI